MLDRDLRPYSSDDFRGSNMFSKYLQTVNTLPRTDSDEIDQKYDVLDVNLLTHFDLMVFQTFEKSFTNGVATYFCYSLSTLCTSDLFTCVNLPRDSHQDEFLLTRKRVSATSRNTKGNRRSGASTIFLTSSDNESDEKEQNSRHDTQGIASVDLVTAIHSVELTPYALFECKSDFKGSSRAKGITQLLGYGLSVRERRELSNDLILVLITPVNWYLAKLPPFGKKLSSTIEFYEYNIFPKKNKPFLKRTDFIQFLQALRCHFKAIKQQE